MLMPRLIFLAILVAPTLGYNPIEHLGPPKPPDAAWAKSGGNEEWMAACADDVAEFCPGHKLGDLERCMKHHWMSISRNCTSYVHAEKINDKALDPNQFPCKQTSRRGVKRIYPPRLPLFETSMVTVSLWGPYSCDDKPNSRCAKCFRENRTADCPRCRNVLLVHSDKHPRSPTWPGLGFTLVGSGNMTRALNCVSARCKSSRRVSCFASPLTLPEAVGLTTIRPLHMYITAPCGNDCLCQLGAKAPPPPRVVEAGAVNVTFFDVEHRSERLKFRLRTLPSEFDQALFQSRLQKRLALRSDSQVVISDVEECAPDAECSQVDAVIVSTEDQPEAHTRAVTDLKVAAETGALDVGVPIEAVEVGEDGTNYWEKSVSVVPDAIDEIGGSSKSRVVAAAVLISVTLAIATAIIVAAALKVLKTRPCYVCITGTVKSARSTTKQPCIECIAHLKQGNSWVMCRACMSRDPSSGRAACCSARKALLEAAEHGRARAPPVNSICAGAEELITVFYCLAGKHYSPLSERAPSTTRRIGLKCNACAGRRRANAAMSASSPETLSSAHSPQSHETVTSMQPGQDAVPVNGYHPSVQPTNGYRGNGMSSGIEFAAIEVAALQAAATQLPSAPGAPVPAPPTPVATFPHDVTFDDFFGSTSMAPASLMGSGSLPFYQESALQRTPRRGGSGPLPLFLDSSQTSLPLFQDDDRGSTAGGLAWPFGAELDVISGELAS